MNIYGKKNYLNLLLSIKEKWSWGISQTCYKALKFKKSSTKNSPAVNKINLFKENAVHYKLQTKHNFYTY